MSYRDDKEDKFPFAKEVEKRFRKYTGMKGPEAEDALRHLTGDTYFEMRMLVSRAMTLIEENIRSGKYPGYKEGVKLTEDDKLDLFRVEEDLKVALKELIEESWRNMLNKQIVGVERLGIALKYQKKPSYEEDQADNPS